MTENQQKIVIGSLLHDIGKVLYQDNKEGKHGEEGYNFLNNEIGLKDHDILDQIRYHHSQSIQNADIENDSFAYITYMADNIASGLDRREKEDEDSGFVQDTALESIFNILNRNNGCSHYRPMILGQNNKINFPTEEHISYDESFYQNIIQKLRDCLDCFAYSDEYINLLLEILEQTLSFVPSVRLEKQMIDISLYDHAKLTAAIASCIYEYLKETPVYNFINDRLVDKSTVLKTLS